MTLNISEEAIVPKDRSGSRFDQVAAELFPSYSRSRIQQWIKQGEMLLEKRKVKPNIKLVGGELVSLCAVVEEEDDWAEEDRPISVIYEDEDVLVIDKPIDLVVHPAAGNWTGTLLNRLIFHYPELKLVPRAGIVHRLDKDTSGLMVVARNLESQLKLVEQLQARTVSRRYLAVVHGECEQAGEINAPIGRHPTARVKMSVLKHGGKEAITHYKPKSKYEGFTLLDLKLETGRTHQIRVHMAHLGFPLVGDNVYGKSLTQAQLKKRPELLEISSFERQALHAYSLALIHPTSKKSISWESKLPNDFDGLNKTLDRHFSYE